MTNTHNNPQRDEKKCTCGEPHISKRITHCYNGNHCYVTGSMADPNAVVPSPKSEVSGEIKNPILLKLLESDEVKRHIDNLLLSQREHDREEMRKKVEGMKVKKCIKSHTNVAQCIMQDCKINSSHYDEALDTILALLK